MILQANQKKCVGLFKVPPSRLSEPSSDYKLREPDMEFVEILKSSIEANEFADVAPLIVTIEVPKNTVREYKGKTTEFGKFLLENRDFYWHTIGGNHSRLAYQSLSEMDPKYDAPRLVKIFVNLTKDEAELIGAEHNKQNLTV